MPDEIDRLIDAGSVRYAVGGMPIHDLAAITEQLDARGLGWARLDDHHLLVARDDEAEVDAVFERVLGLDTADSTGESSPEALPRPAGDLVTVFEDNSQFTVEMMRQRLANEGIAASMAGGPGGGFTEVPSVVGIYYLQVLEPDADKAAALLGVAEAVRPAPVRHRRWMTATAVAFVALWFGAPYLQMVGRLVRDLLGT